ncbi:MAG: 50S ribosomal protein L14e [Nanoarchaeota archaeon]|nr:50S ribosomal protein L14e [Nanoarchaeota archaeon]MBU1004342.1 50S ribosomal protein L14e [Nanoarchaeota archaeon]MBU1946307.1 50S ribosomal protein L14e [Nanoarchaeota archaeon]
MIEVGRICIKLCGRDAGGEAAIVDILDDTYALIDGNVRRRKCNIFHLEPTSKKIDIKKGDSHDIIKAEFEKLGLSVWDTKKKEKTQRPLKQRGKKAASAENPKKDTKNKKEPAKEAKKEAKPAEIKKEAKAEVKTEAKEAKQETLQENPSEKKRASKKLVKEPKPE